jgi:hypothetical protein
MSTFTDFDVVRVGDTVFFTCFSTEPPPTGCKLQMTLGYDSREQAELYEQMFRRLAGAPPRTKACPTTRSQQPYNS